MATQNVCLKCGAPLTKHARQRFCPTCLIRQAGAGWLDPAASSETEIGGRRVEFGGQNPAGSGQRAEVSNQATAPPSSRVPCPSSLAGPPGDYELLEEIGRGGMGVVYRARQRSLDRVVAVKMMAFGPGSSPELVKRFRAEAVSAASLHHPNIVAIYEVGIQEGQHFFVMDYVEGQSLARLVGNQPLPAKRAAGYLKLVAEAVHYAHERGILHRDLKPSNVLVDADDQPRVVDFGLARRLDGQSELTVTGQVLGSPHYLPPEQATGQRAHVSRRTDVYGLGATLYHLLTGRPPFQAEALAQTLDLVLHADPVSPRLLNPSVPRDLETICLKCLEKEPSRRYSTAQELADELARFQAGEPIHARPLGPTGKLWRWCRRKPQMASLAAVASLAVLLGCAGVLAMWRQAEAQRAHAEANGYVLSINVAQQALKANNPARALELLNRYRPDGESALRGPHAALDRRGFEWRYLWQQCQSDAEAVIGRLGLGVRSLDVSADGRWLFAGSQRAAPRVWNLGTGEVLPLRAEPVDWAWGAFSPDSRWLLVCPQTVESYGSISVWDLQARKELAPIVDGRPVGPMAFSPNGQRFGYAVLLTNQTPSIVVLDFPSRDPVCELSGHTRTPDERKGWEWLFTRDGRKFIGSDRGFGGGICLWELIPGSEPQEFGGHHETITAMALSPDGRVLATGAGYTETDIKLWEVPSVRPLGELSGHQAWISALRFSPDGRTLASAAADQTMRLWDVATRTPRRVIVGLPANVWRLCFSGDGSTLFSGSADGSIHRWSIDARPPERAPAWRRSTALEKVVVAPDARRFAGLRNGIVCLGETVGATLPSEVRELGANNTCLLFSADGQSLFAGTQDGTVQVWSLDRRLRVRCLRGSARSVAALRQDRQARTLVAVHWRGRTDANGSPRPRMDSAVEVQAWRTDGWQARGPWDVAGPWAIYAVSPDGRWLAADAGPNTIEVLSLSGPAQTHTLPLAAQLCGLAFSPDGRFLAGATTEGAVKVWEVPGFRDRKEIRARSHGLSALAFSPDSQRLATAGEGAEAIKLWEVATWQELITLPCEGGTLREVDFTADGNQLVAGNAQGDLFFWRAPTLSEIETSETGAEAQYVRAKGTTQ